MGSRAAQQATAVNGGMDGESMEKAWRRHGEWMEDGGGKGGREGGAEQPSRSTGHVCKWGGRECVGRKGVRGAQGLPPRGAPRARVKGPGELGTHQGEQLEGVPRGLLAGGCWGPICAWSWDAGAAEWSRSRLENKSDHSKNALATTLRMPCGFRHANTEGPQSSPPARLVLYPEERPQKIFPEHSHSFHLLSLSLSLSLS